MLHFLRYAPFDSLAAWRSLLRDAALLRNPARLPPRHTSLLSRAAMKGRCAVQGRWFSPRPSLDLIRTQVLSWSEGRAL